MYKKCFILSLSVFLVGSTYAENIVFADEVVKSICVENWDTDQDGELSLEEAGAVTELGSVFKANKNIVSFEELKHFTGLTRIDSYAFYQSSIETIKFPETVTLIDEYAFCQSNIGEDLYIPGTIKEIGHYAFYNCKKLKKVVLEEGFETIGWHTFAGPIETLSLPKSLVFMYSMAIDPYVNGDSSLGIFVPEGDIWVFAHSETPASINGLAFHRLLYGGHLVVPFGSKEVYKDADAWSHFHEYFEQGDVNADGYIDPEDVKLLQQVLDGEDVELKNALLADVNGDGMVDAADMDELNTHFYAEDGTPTMIAEAETKEQGVPEGVYTIDGRKVLDDASQIQSLRPGIYISQGRKFVVR